MALSTTATSLSVVVTAYDSHQQRLRWRQQQRRSELWQLKQSVQETKQYTDQRMVERITNCPKPKAS